MYGDDNIHICNFEVFENGKDIGSKIINELKRINLDRNLLIFVQP